MPHSATSLTGDLEFVNLRRFTVADQAQWMADRAAGHIMLTANLALPRDVWNQLPRWEQTRVWTMAVGRSSYRAVVVGHAAARIWRLPLLTAWDQVELCAPGRTYAPSSSQWPRNVVYRNWHPPSSAVMAWQGLRVTARHRTLFDVVRTGSFAQGLAVLDAELRVGTVSRATLAQKFRGFGRAHGVRRVRTALRLADPLAESPLESKARAQLIDAALPEVTGIELQAPVTVHGVTYRIDILINGWLGVELDGEVKYGHDTDQAIRSERAREKRIQNTGIRLLRFSHVDLAETAGQPSRFITGTAEALRRHAQRAA